MAIANPFPESTPILLRIAAFADGDSGGNPAGVHLAGGLPEPGEMQRIAAEVGFSETAFAAPAAQGWRVRYFSPEAEVPFCGHATIALGAALALRQGDGRFALELNEASISVSGWHEGDSIAAALDSPPTRSAAADAALDIMYWPGTSRTCRINNHPGALPPGPRDLLHKAQKL